MQLFRVTPLAGNLATLGWLAAAFFCVWMFTDCLGSRVLPVGWKIVWLSAMIFLPVLGSILYLLLAKGGRGSRPLV